jgi:hypothetical protein
VIAAVRHSSVASNGITDIISRISASLMISPRP